MLLKILLVLITVTFVVWHGNQEMSHGRSDEKKELIPEKKVFIQLSLSDTQ